MATIPEGLKSKLALFNRYFSKVDTPFYEAIQRLMLTSDYACRHIDLLEELSTEEAGIESPFENELGQLSQRIPLDSSHARFSQGLRRLRHKILLKIYLRQLAGISSVEETLAQWSACADALIIHCLAYCQQVLSQRHGRPLDEQGKLSHLLVLAMGKLGGAELNFSSDVDLIFAYTANGNTDGGEQLFNQDYFKKVVQLFVQLMQTNTIDGFVFRVDLRLRPNGDSGSIAPSLDSMETYYQEQGRDWERYAMVKARLINPPDDAIRRTVEDLIRPFVYRRYVDFSVIESLRSMKIMIDREVQLDPRLDNIKRGKGGIREVEFIIQNIQLIRGGRMPQLQEQNAMKALLHLKEEGLIDRADVLCQAYLFLRILENALQILNDQQTHALPADDLRQLQVAYALGYDDWEQCHARLQQYQRIISQCFHKALNLVDVYEDDKRMLMNQLSSVWHGHVEKSMAINLLASLGFSEAEHCYQMLYTFRHGSRCRRLSQVARIRLDNFMVLLLMELSAVSETEKVLLKVMSLLENTVSRSAYLALLTENPVVLKELLYWFANSDFISSLLVTYPFLLEILLNQEQVWRPLSRKQLSHLLSEQLAHCPDPEMQDDLLRQFKLMQWLLAARAELHGQVSAIRVGRFLTDVAEVIVAEVFQMASVELTDKYPEMIRIKQDFSIVAYGKAGGREMNYDSDLDLVFLYKACVSEEHLVTRLTRKILHKLTTRTQMGILYTVDTRLRPSGSAGLLVSHIDAFKAYQLGNAWTWEHQAIIKARVMMGSSVVKKMLASLKREILAMKRNRNTLCKDVLEMRAKIDKYQHENDIKYAPGGLLDLEFLIQFLVLASGNTDFSRLTHPLIQLEKLHKQTILSFDEIRVLRQAYKRYHKLIHRSVLNNSSSRDEKTRLGVVSVCKKLYGIT